MKRLLVVAVLSLLAAAILPTSALATHKGPLTIPVGLDFIKTGPVLPPPFVVPATGPLATPCGSASSTFRVSGPSGFGPARTVPLFSTSNAATGRFSFATSTFGCLGFTSAQFDGAVTCLKATGQTSPENSANWFGVINNVTLQPGNVPGIPGLLFPGMGVVGRWVDNWFPATPDSANAFTTPTPLSCFSPFITTPFSTLPITSGNLVVHDGIL